MQTNSHTGTRIDEVAPGIYRINTPLRIDAIPGGFNLSQYLIVDDEPMVFHTGWRKWFPFVSEAISKVIPLDRIRHVGYSHFEGDEAGAMNEFLAVAPHAIPFASYVSLMTSLNDFADRKVDGHVKRTADRPLASGRVKPREALVLFAVLVAASFLLVLCTNAQTVWLSFGAVALAFCYPFMKRYTYYPQVVLGAAYSWGIPMAFTAAGGTTNASLSAVNVTVRSALTATPATAAESANSPDGMSTEAMNDVRRARFIQSMTRR